MDRRTILRTVGVAGVTAGPVLATGSSASAQAGARAGELTIYAQRAQLTLPSLPVRGVTFSARLNLFSDKTFETPIGTGSAAATVIDIDRTDLAGGIATLLVHSTLVLARDSDPAAAVTLTTLFRRRNAYPDTYLATPLGGHGDWAPSTDTSSPAKITAHGGGVGPRDYLAITWRTASP